MKVHVGASTIYLDGYVNVDLPPTALAVDHPELAEAWSTTEDNYYGRHQDKTIDVLRRGPADQLAVCDVHGSFQSLPFDDSSVDEILSRQAFEHMSITEARAGLREMRRVLKVGGILRLDVPDYLETLVKWYETKDAFYLRHLLGNRNGDYGYHVMGYDREGLKRLVTEHGFEFVEEEQNIHHYPAMCLRFRACA